MLRATQASYNVVNRSTKPRRHDVVCNVNAMFLCMSIRAIEAHVTKGACARRSPRCQNRVGRSPAVPLGVQSPKAGSHDLAGLCRASPRCLNSFGRSPMGQSAVGRSPGPQNGLGRSPGCDPARVVGCRLLPLPRTLPARCRCSPPPGYVEESRPQSPSTISGRSLCGYSSRGHLCSYFSEHAELLLSISCGC